MKGDFSRETFDKRKHYASVLMQQGRVQVDADWNEQQAITQHRMQTTAADLIGRSGVPSESPGFGLQVEPGGGDLSISPGRIYVDGILCELEDQSTFRTQPDYPVSDSKMPKPGTYVAYLDVWLRHITALDDPQIRETALGGADTCSRSRVVWQVKLASLEEWNSLLAESSGRLAARARPASIENSFLPPGAKYRGLENQLYRVEIHRASEKDNPPMATFKWSHDNGSVVVPIDPKVNGNEITVHSLGPDREGGFADGQWIEIVDDTTELLGTPRKLYQILKVVPEKGIIQVTGESVDSDQIGAHPKVRRWDGKGEVVTKDGVAIDKTFQALEDGIEVRFSGGPFKAGDYWLIPARSAKGDVEWPVKAADDPIAQPPLGIKHHYCRLAEIAVAGDGFKSVNDLREPFNPIADSLVAKVIVGQSDNAIVLRNGYTIKGSALANGLEISLHRSIDAASATRATCFVTLDVPFRNENKMVGFQSIALAANVSADAMRIKWHPTDDAKSFLSGLPRDSVTLTKEWDVIPQDQAADNWRYLSVAEGNVAEGKAPNPPQQITGGLEAQMAVYQSPLRSAAQRLRFSAVPPEADAEPKIVGLVFNYKSRTDFWLISAELKAGETVNEKTVVASVEHFEEGQRTRKSEPASFPEVLKIQRIDIEYNTKEAEIRYIGEDLTGGPFVQTIKEISPPLDESLRVGVITSFSELTTFRRLSVSYSSTEEIFLPRSEDVVKLFSLLTVRRQFLTPGSPARRGSREQALITPLPDASMWFWIEPDGAQQ